MLLTHKDAAQRWIDAGLATRGEKGKNENLSTLSFSHAKAKGYVYFTGDGANLLDREAIKNLIRPSELKAKWR